ncbi:hypothetical protein MBLNU457_g0653t1 [Dothideomycetes sp. NU457]
MAQDKKRKRESAGEDNGKVSKKKQENPEKPASFIAVDAKGLDPTLSSLFANSAPISKPDKSAAAVVPRKRKSKAAKKETEAIDSDDEDGDNEGLEDNLEEAIADVLQRSDHEEEVVQEKPAHKRKRKDQHDDLETEYMERLAKSREKDNAKLRKQEKETKGKAVDGLVGQEDAQTSDEEEDEDSAVEEDVDEDDIVSEDEDEDDEMMSPPPQHESLKPEADEDMMKAQRTVFLANVASEAIKSKKAKKALLAHLSSFFPSMPKPKEGEPTHAVESLRFRSTAFASSVPKKAAFAKREIMDATTKSTNAYAVYTSNALAREAARKLNGTIVLDRHLRVDEVAHPAKTDHRRCIFVGNLGFVDDESNIDKANEQEGYRTNHGNKRPGDVEEGLWRTFGKCGTVESVRVVRDSKTRVGKGFAYVQFTDENGVEAALEYNDKRFPPMLPRKLRVMRAKAQKRNARPNPESTRASTFEKTRPKGGFVPKLTPEQQSQLGRANRLFGRSAASQMRRESSKSGKLRTPATGADGASFRRPTGSNGVGIGSGSTIKAPETFVFEGHRATSKSGKSGLKLGGAKSGKTKKGKPTTRSSKRGSAWKASGGRAGKE